TAPSRIRRRTTSNPVSTGDSSGAGMSLPSDVLAQTCKRMFTVGLSFAGLWTLSFLVFYLLRQQVATMGIMADIWVVPGASISLIGVATSLLLVGLSVKFSPQPDLLLEMGSAFLVINCFLFGLMEFWSPRFDVPHTHWLGIMILAYSGI